MFAPAAKEVDQPAAPDHPGGGLPERRFANGFNDHIGAAPAIGLSF